MIGVATGWLLLVATGARAQEADVDWGGRFQSDMRFRVFHLDDPEGRLQARLARFVQSVRTALNRLRLEVRAIRAQQVHAAKSF